MTKIFKAHTPKPRGPRPPRARPPDDDKRPAVGVAAEGVAAEGAAVKPAGADGAKPKEIGGPSGPEPTRYGDWERKGICVDF
jgi:hypothetical protein